MQDTLVLLAFVTAVLGQQYSTTWDPNNLPNHTEQDQHGTNQCGTGNNQTSLCQNAYVNSVDDFCIWGPPEPGQPIGNVEQIMVSYCTRPGRGGRLIPPGALTAAHFIETDEYVQVSGLGDFTKINVLAGDAGGEMDPHGPDGLGNPHGGLVFSNAFQGHTGPGQQIHEWTNFQSVDQFCIRACKPGPRAEILCEHIYDVMGCAWNMPGDYGPGFTSCEADVAQPMGLYPQPDGSTSTFFQGQGATPAPHPAPSSSQCSTYTSASIYSTALTTSSPTQPPTGTGTNSGTATATSDNRSSGVAVSTQFGAVSASLLVVLIAMFTGALVI